MFFLDLHLPITLVWPRLCDKMHYSLDAIVQHVEAVLSVYSWSYSWLSKRWIWYRMDWQLTVFWMRNQYNTLKLNKKDIKEGDGLLSQARSSTKALVLSFACLQTCWVKIAGTKQLHIDWLWPIKFTNEYELEPTSGVYKENSACGQLSRLFPWNIAQGGSQITIRGLNSEQRNNILAKVIRSWPHLYLEAVNSGCHSIPQHSLFTLFTQGKPIISGIYFPVLTLCRSTHFY